MRKWILFLMLLAVCIFSYHDIPPENYGPPYLYPENPADRLYRIPLKAGYTSYISGGWCTDTHGGYLHADFAVDFDCPVGDTAFCARAGKVLAIEPAPGGLASYYTIEIGRADSVRDSTSPRGNGWRVIQTKDMYRHMINGSKFVNLGEWVEQGEPVARVNNVAHVHFEVNVNPANSYISPVDPTDSISSIPVPFVGITSQPQGFPERTESYMSQNHRYTGIEQGPLPAFNQNCPVSLSVFPNPFRPSAAFRISVNRTQSDVNLGVFDANGRLVESLFFGSLLNPGNYKVSWYPAGLSSGVYFCMLKTDKKIISKRIYKMK
jgi:murein DD-endopeptidase MepM/ murein hydrolase activator NlpD